ncbi:MAG: hypothetical protein HQK53_14885 [Oligoflexia bacterium]|nr:hypothetical protein [Oligoflexia bacterium]
MVHRIYLFQVISYLLILCSVNINAVFASVEIFDSNCEVKYRNLLAACLPGRAEGEVPLPINTKFGKSAIDDCSSWSYGPYDEKYAGKSFNTEGTQINFNISIMPPYMWGAIGQICDVNFNPDTYQRCLLSVNHKLSDPLLNALSLSGNFYWRAHGHNCHDAVEDVGTCFLRAARYMQSKNSNCPLDVRVIVWDAEPDISKALGNIYHSQLLLKLMTKKKDQPTSAEDLSVCLVESQQKNISGLIANSCCSKNLKLFSGTKFGQYKKEFKNCPNFLTVNDAIIPHIYEINTFRQNRRSGEMDVLNSYNRDAGVAATVSGEIIYTETNPPIPKIISAAYDEKGIAIMLNVR